MTSLLVTDIIIRSREERARQKGQPVPRIRTERLETPRTKQSGPTLPLDYHEVNLVEPEARVGEHVLRPSDGLIILLPKPDYKFQGHLHKIYTKFDP